jgi:hypothetical protein
MSKVLTTATAAAMLAFATMGAAPALATNYHDYRPWNQAQTLAPHYAMHYYGGPKSPMWPSFARAQGVAGLACDLPSSTCSNNERIND